jgi:hypothetical protein
LTVTSRVFVKPFIEYNPLPPMIPISACVFARFDFSALTAAILFSP